MTIALGRGMTFPVFSSWLLMACSWLLPSACASRASLGPIAGAIAGSIARPTAGITAGPTPAALSGPAKRECGGHFEERAGPIVALQGFAGASLFFPQGEAAQQRARYPGILCPQEALALAASALLSSTEPEALLSVANELAAKECGARCLVHRQSSLIGIVADAGSQTSHRLLPGAPSGRQLQENWVFFLSVSDLSEHGYWALVARDGSGVSIEAQN